MSISSVFFYCFVNVCHGCLSSVIFVFVFHCHMYMPPKHDFPFVLNKCFFAKTNNVLCSSVLRSEQKTWNIMFHFSFMIFKYLPFSGLRTDLFVTGRWEFMKIMIFTICEFWWLIECSVGVMWKPKLGEAVVWVNKSICQSNFFRHVKIGFGRFPIIWFGCPASYCISHWIHHLLTFGLHFLKWPNEFAQFLSPFWCGGIVGMIGDRYT